MEQKRILQVLTIMNQGGAETMIMNFYRALDKSKYQFDFLVNRQERGFYDDEIESMGGRIYRAFPIRPWTYLQYFAWLDNFFKEHHDYAAVHSHIQENSGFIHKYAKKYGIQVRVSHSHIADLGMDLRYPFREFGKLFVHKYTTQNLGCGVDAGKYLFGERPFETFNNSIQTGRFLYNEEKRNEMRRNLGLENKLVVGNVARLGYQKNHKFLIDVFAELLKMNSNAHLLLVGDGDLKADILKQVSTLGIDNHFTLLSKRPDVNDILQAFDVFFMPSLFEGLPVSVVEAQAAGLHCVLSDTIDKQTDITGNVRFVSLQADLSEWVDALIDAANAERKNTSEFIIKAGYDVYHSLNRLLNIYKLQ